MFSRNEISREEIELEVHGALDGEAAERFQETLQELAAAGYQTITLNLSAVPSINSTCIGKMLLLRKELTTESRLIRVRGCSEALHNTFQLIKLDRLLSVERQARGEPGRKAGRQDPKRR